ncbi:LysR family transcriptional regulator [Shimia sp. R11_0]|uniref:LysR family transcriptional regulator n=1 Tax=Shimia sp. R11_0 TaxID=2821096 RepID=UPI001FFE032D|nr:LysR family transcriptional regulator [Shimia sp. R11_0]
MSDWDGIDEFAMVAQTGSFTTAAQRMKVSTSHVSRRVQALEERLGVKLLARTTRTVRVTEQGREYLSQIEHVLSALQEANQTLRGDIAELSGPLRISAAGPFAEREVAPVLLDFVEQHPRITLDMDFNNRNVDLVADGYDFALRYGVLTNSSLIARKLVNHRLACVASPAYLKRHGIPKTPQDLRQHSCLVTSNDTWLFQDPDTKAALPVKVSGRLRTNDIPMLQEAVRRGFGIAYSPIGNLQGLIDAGEAELILQPYEDHSRSHWIVYADRHLMPRHVRAAIDHLLTIFAAQR